MSDLNLVADSNVLPNGELNSVPEGVDPDLIFTSVRHINARGYCIDVYTLQEGEWPQGETRFIGRHHMIAVVGKGKDKKLVRVPLDFDIEAGNLKEAFKVFGYHAKAKAEAKDAEQAEEAKEAAKPKLWTGNPKVRKGKSR